jgi:hypothetical protein
MKAALWMAAAAVGSALAVVAVAGRQTAREVSLGLLAPLLATAASWVITERTYRADPVRLTGLMTAGFAAKMVFFGAYVAAMLKLVGLAPVAFVASFTAYFIALYLTEALLMRRLFSRER